MGSCSLVVPVLTHNSRSHKSTASSKMVVSLFSLISVILVTSSSAFVIQEEPLEQIEVKVNYGDELERLLMEAVRAGRTKEVEDILIAEIESIEERIRSRGFFYMGEGVKLRGTNVGATKEIIDSVKDQMVDTTNRLKMAKMEIKLLLKEIHVSAPGMEETLLDILTSLRDVPAYTELKYRDAITDGFELRIEDVTNNGIHRK